MVKLALGLILTAAIFALAGSPATAAEARWSPINTPAEGDAGNWVLAAGSDVRHLSIAIGGSLYCHANPTGTTYTLFKSTGGRQHRRYRHRPG